MEIDLALLSDAATVDASGKLNVLGVFDRITATGFPAKHPRLSLVLRLTASMNEAGEHEVVITLRDPEGEEMGRINGTMGVGFGPADTGGRLSVPQVINMDGLVFTQPGRYAFDVEIDGEHHVSVPLFLHQAPTPPAAAQA
jgi:hypothetical protein